MISGFRACRYWIALKLHFTTRKYDFFEHKAKIVNFNEEVYLARKDVKQFERIARKYDEAVSEYFLANLLVGNKSIWNTAGIDSHDVYFNWLSRRGARAYHLKKDLSRNNIMDRKDLSAIIAMREGSTPILFEMFCQGKITPETIILLDFCIPFLDHWDAELSTTLWGNGALVLLKYRPFINCDKPELIKILEAHNLCH